MVDKTIRPKKTKSIFNVLGDTMWRSIEISFMLLYLQLPHQYLNLQRYTHEYAYILGPLLNDTLSISSIENEIFLSKRRQNTRNHTSKTPNSHHNMECRMLALVHN